LCILIFHISNFSLRLIPRNEITKSNIKDYKQIDGFCSIFDILLKYQLLTINLLYPHKTLSRVKKLAAGPTLELGLPAPYPLLFPLCSMASKLSGTGLKSPLLNKEMLFQTMESCHWVDTSTSFNIKRWRRRDVVTPDHSGGPRELSLLLWERTVRDVVDPRSREGGRIWTYVKAVRDRVTWGPSQWNTLWALQAKVLRVVPIKITTLSRIGFAFWNYLKLAKSWNICMKHIIHNKSFFSRETLHLSSWWFKLNTSHLKHSHNK